MPADRSALLRLIVLLLVFAAWAYGCALLAGCTITPGPVTPPTPPEPEAPLCERACLRRAELACTPVIDLMDCTKVCEQYEALAAEAGAEGIGWNPKCMVQASSCPDWEACRGDGT